MTPLSSSSVGFGRRLLTKIPLVIRINYQAELQTQRLMGDETSLSHPGESW